MGRNLLGWAGAGYIVDRIAAGCKRRPGRAL